MRITSEQNSEGGTYFIATQRAPDGKLLMAEGESRRMAAEAIYAMLGYTPRASWLAIQEQFGPVRDVKPVRKMNPSLSRDQKRERNK
jgi:hypothetical protein